MNLIDLILERGALKEEEKGEALRQAVLHGNFELAQGLRLRGLDVNAPIYGYEHGETALQSALEDITPENYWKSLPIVKLLLENGADVNPTQCICGEDHETYTSPLQIALRLYRVHSDTSLVQLLLDHGADINVPADIVLDGRIAGIGGGTALQYAVFAPHPDYSLVQYLLDHGADVNAAPAEMMGRTALQAAISSNYYYEIQDLNLKVIQLLLDNHADINAPPARESGVTALQAAAIIGNHKIAIMLLEQGADPNAPGSAEEGRTALEGAAEYGHLDMVQLLLNAVATPSGSAVEFAENEGHYVVADFLREKIKDCGNGMTE